jgi:hypothetical protein
MSAHQLAAIRAALEDGLAIPYLGPGVLALIDGGGQIPASAADLVVRLTAKASVPHKIRNNLSAAAQFIENFKHRKTVVKAMTEAFTSDCAPTPLHHALAAIARLPLIVHAWYDDLPQKALARRKGWGLVQGVSQTEHFGTWAHYFNADGTPIPTLRQTSDTQETIGVVPAEPPIEALAWSTLLYEPLGAVTPAANYLVSDTDFVEVLTEIDIQTPIPLPVQELRKGRNFLFVGCRFANQLDRIFARQIMKRSSAKHWAVLPEEPTRNELRFLAEQGIERVDMPLAAFAAWLAGEREGGRADARALAVD